MAVPYVNVRITRDGATTERKRELIAGITRLLHDVMDKDPADVTVIIDEIDDENWGLSGDSVAERMKAKAGEL